MAREPDGWLICDNHICLYSEWGARSLDRCIKHGAILTWLGWGSGLSRQQVRAKMAEADRRAEASDRRQMSRLW